MKQIKYARHITVAKKWGVTRIKLKRKYITTLVLSLFMVSVMMTLVNLGTLHQNGERVIDQLPTQTITNPPTQTPQPSPSATPKNPTIRLIPIFPLTPTFKTVTILSSIGGTTEPPEGTHIQIENLEIVVTTNKDYLFSCWEITADGVTWTEPPWNPCIVIYDGCTIRPIFTYIGVGPSPTESPTSSPAPTPSPTPTRLFTNVVFGETGYGFEDGWNPAGYHPSSRFQMVDLTDARITKLTCYVLPSVSGMHAKMAVYSDSSMTPNMLLGVSSEVTLTNDRGFTWIDFTFSEPISVSANAFYWFSFVADNDVSFRCTATTTGLDTYVWDSYTSNAYAAGFNSPYGTVMNGTTTVASVYATLLINPT
jgi:hypothetical protein